MNYYMPIAIPLQGEIKPETSSSDPVTKALMDNIMGKLPTNKSVICKCDSCMKTVFSDFIPSYCFVGRRPSKKRHYKCDICKLVLPSKIIFLQHLTGSKHDKKLKSQGMRGENNEKKNYLRCETCDIYVNSTQQLQTHLTGSKHLKATKKGTGVKESSNDEKPNTNLYSYSIPTTSNFYNPTPSSSGMTKSKPEKEEQTVEILPAGIQKIPETAASKAVKYFCNNCSVTLNSHTQLKQHIASKKHKEREKGAGKVKKVWKKTKPYQQPSPTLHNDPAFFYQYKQPLSCNFVSGGSIF